MVDKQFTFGGEFVAVELGTYNPDKQSFSVTLSSKTDNIKVAMNGTIPLTRDPARLFKQQYQAGAIRPQVGIKANGDVMTVALVSDSDSSIYEYVDGEFMTVGERKRIAAEKERLIYTDPQTGLQWTRNANIAGKAMNWQEAMDWSKNLTYAGYNDWRLPTKDELESMAKRGGKRPSEWLNANGFNNVQDSFYWSSTTYAGNPGYVWGVYFSDGDVYYGSKGDGYYVRCVRGGQ